MDLTQSNKDKKLRIGELGERLVYEYHSNAERSADWYDSKKDLTIGSLTAEVKTMTRILKYDEFWLDENQLNKIKNVGLLFILEISINKSSIPLYICPNNRSLGLKERSAEGISRKRIVIPRRILYKITEFNNSYTHEIMKLSDSLSEFRRERKYERS